MESKPFVDKWKGINDIFLFFETIIKIFIKKQLFYKMNIPYVITVGLDYLII